MEPYNWPAVWDSKPRAYRTPGKRKAMKALGAAKKRNVARAKAGKPVSVGGKKIKADTYKKKFGMPKRAGGRGVKPASSRGGRKGRSH